MTAIREQILAAAEVALAAIPGFDFAHNDERAFPIADAPGLRMYDGGKAPPTAQVTGSNRYRLRFTVEICVNAKPLGTSLNAAYVQVVTALWADPTLGGVAVELTAGEMTNPEIHEEEGTAPAVGAAVVFEVDFFTGEFDLEVTG